MNEFQLIERIRRIFEGTGAGRPDVILGIGDDAAVLDPGSEMVVSTTDSIVEGTHFEWSFCVPSDVGYKSVTVNLSDLAAMGARPVAILVSFSIPRDMKDSCVLQVARGAAQACARYGVRAVGGNVTATAGPFDSTITALGLTHGNRFLSRKGARPGDSIFVSGPLGSAALGREVLSGSTSRRRSYPSLARSFLRPEPQIRLGSRLLSADGVHCAIDVSDGLLADLDHLIRPSGTGARLDLERLPIDDESWRFHGKGGGDPIEAALTGGEDYQLLACVDGRHERGVEAMGMVRIGMINGRKGRVDLYREGRRVPAPAITGFRHR